MNEDDEIQFRPLAPDDFQKGILAGEIKPHDVEITVRYRDGKEYKVVVGWEIICSLYKLHNASAVDTMYQLTVESNL
jgi:hypothetical protein